MKKKLLTIPASLVIAWAGLFTGVFADGASQAETEKAWLAFVNARGEASLLRGDINHPTATHVFRAIPPVGTDDLQEDKLQLGFELFNDPRLSRDGSVSCASCHIGMLGGVDRRPIPFGIDGTPGTLNAPTIFNAALNFRQFWDGRALNLQEQALMPIENPAEMDHALESVVATLQNIPEYVDAFQRFYPDGITAANLGNAISYYETMNFTALESPFLRQFEEGQEALSEQALRGQQRFVEVGCGSCHNGLNLGGNSYQQVGVAIPWFGANRIADAGDEGLFGRTGREQDKHVFKVPTLHNVALTGPWFHDGSITTLQQAVDLMARHQSGRYLDNQDIDDIVAFLRTLHDRLALIGDCAASGNYGVTLDCDVKQRSTEGGEQSQVQTAALPPAGQLARQHQNQYQQSLALVAEAPDRIHWEMQRIRSGEVAHYDFLQYEHLEMLRHARALSYPPANLTPADRESAEAEAARWQQSAEQFEFTIADFLRRHAVATSAKLNYQDLLRAFSENADERTLLKLAQAEESALRYYEHPEQATQQKMEEATQELESLSLNAVLLSELHTQARLLIGALSEDARFQSI